MRFSPGDSVGRFVIEALLGEGGMGEVYLAVDSRLERHVALKVLRKGAEDDGETWGRAVARMLREARAVAALSHPSIVAIYDVGEHEGTPFIAMEFVKGSSMRELVDAGRPLQARLRALLDVARALAAAHRAGLIHRDIKPENVIVLADGSVKVLDFGIARRSRASKAVDALSVTALAEGAGATVTAEGAIVGTPAYMAPEQLRGEAIDARADQFAWGIVAYELLGGRRPFRGGATPVSLIASILSDDPEPISGVPAGVMDVVLRALRKKPDDRFASMDDLAQQLSSVVTFDAPGPLVGGDSTAPLVRGDAAATPVASDSAMAASRRRLKEAATQELPRRTWNRWAIALPIVGAIAASVVAVRLREPASGAAPASSASAAEPAAPAPAPTAVTDLPTPKTESPEARLAFREGMQAIRDATWGTAVAAFERARKADPGFAAAHLRFAILGVSFDVARAREAFRKASGLRSSLTERDQGFLDALEPVVQNEPEDYVAATRKMEALVARFPTDAELVFWNARLLLNQRASSDRAARAHGLLERCVALDPLYADCWQTSGRALGILGRADEASAALEKCIEVSPGALDCLQDKIWNDTRRGRCADAVNNLRQWIVKEPDAPRPYAMLARALYAQGEAEGAVASALDQAAKRFKAQGNELLAAEMEVTRAEAFGDFAAASRASAAASSLHAPLPGDEVGFAIGRIFLELEQGHAAKAGAIADDLIAQAALRPALLGGENRFNPTIFMHSVRLKAGSIARPEFLRIRSDWVAERQKKDDAVSPWALWMSAYGSAAWTAEDAKEAIEREPPLEAFESEAKDNPVLRLFRGRLHALVGDTRAALPLVEETTRLCTVIANPIEHNQFRALLGALREATGDAPGACVMYKEVLSRWGRASSSITVKDVSKRAKALGCGK